MGRWTDWVSMSILRRWLCSYHPREDISLPFHLPRPQQLLESLTCTEDQSISSWREGRGVRGGQQLPTP